MIMWRHELGARATLMILPARPGQAVSSPRHYSTLAHAIRHVMEVLPHEQRQSAVIQTPTRLLFVAEIEAVFEKIGPCREVAAFCS
jgi:hypothetical protein